MAERRTEEPADRGPGPAGVIPKLEAVRADRAALAAEAAALARDPVDRAEMAEIRALMQGMAPA